MTLYEKYRYNSRRKNSNLKLYLFLAVLFILSTTLARYANVSNFGISTQIAKWSIKINGEQLTSDKDTLDTKIQLNIDNQLNDGIIRNGDTGYFEIEIDPRGTEVTIDYAIDLSFIKKPSEVRTDMLFTHYSLNDEQEKHVLTNNKIDGTTQDKIIYLNDMPYLGDLQVRKYKIYWKWEGTDLNLKEEDCIVNAKVTVRQVI